MAAEGDICPSCLENSNINVLKYLYINLNEAVLKCESSSCLYPFKNFKIKSINTQDLDTSIPLESKLDDNFLNFLDNKSYITDDSSLDIKKCSPKKEKPVVEEDNSNSSTGSIISSSSTSSVNQTVNQPNTEKSLKITRCLRNLKLRNVKTENSSQTTKVKPHVRRKVCYNNMEMTPLNFLKNLGTLK